MLGAQVPAAEPGIEPGTLLNVYQLSRLTPLQLLQDIIRNKARLI